MAIRRDGRKDTSVLVLRKAAWPADRSSWQTSVSRVVFDAVSDFRKPMDLSLSLGANRSHAQRHGEDLQRRDGGKDAV